MMFHRLVSSMPSQPFSASLSRSFCARAWCHSSGSRSNVAGAGPLSGRNSAADFCAAAAGAAITAPAPETVTAAPAPVVAMNSLRFIMACSCVLRLG